MAKCPNCGGELSPQENGLWTCAVCGKVYSRKVVTVQDTLPADQTEAELRARIAAMEAKQAETERQLAAAQAKSGGGGKAAEFFRSKKHLLKYIIPGVLLLVACIILLVCFCGLRGIYVNVDNPNDYFSFGVGTFSTVDSGDVVDGKWSRDGDTLTLTLEDELLGEIELPVSFKKVSGYDVVEIDGAEYKRVSVIRMEDNLSKVNISFNANGGSFTEGRSSYDLSLGGKIDSAPSVERSSGNYIFMGWYTSPDSWTTGEGERFSPGIRLWEDASYYANWRNDTDYTMSVPDILNRGEDAPEITYREGDDLLSVFMTALGWSELPDGITGVSFSTSSGAVDGSSAPAANVTAELIGDYMVLDGVLKYVSPSLTEFVIPDSAISISSRAFDDCSGLASVTIGANITSLNTSVFDDCDELTTLNVAEGNTVYRSAGNCIIDAENQTLILGCKGSVIPADGSVTTIGENAFNGLTGLISITIPESITKIEDSAFENCTGLTEINWNAIAVEDFAEFSSYMYEYEDVYTKVFSGAGTDGSGITVTFGDAVTHVPAGLFYSLNNGLDYDYITPNIKSVFLGDNVAAIGAYAFARCEGITEIILPDSVTSIEEGAFYGCTGLTSVTIPDSVTSIGYHAFYGCSGLTSVTIGNGVTSIGYDAFWGCTGLTYNEYDNAYYLGNETNPYLVLMKAKDIDITSCAICEQTKFIYGSAFSGCSGLTSVTIPDSVTIIGNYAFEDCTGLTSITIPDSVTIIGSDVFSGCRNIATATMPTSAIDYIPQNSLQTVVLTSGERIQSYAFRYCDGLTSVTIPDSVTSIGDYAFERCDGLMSVTIPDSVTSIGDYAFSGCSGLRSIYYTGDVASWCGVSGLAGVMSSGRTLYIDGKKVEGDLVIPDGVTSIGDYAFYDCSGLTSVTIPDSVTSIGRNAFDGCTNLIKRYGVSYVDGWVIYADSDIKTASIRQGTRGIADYAFQGCSSLTSVTIPDSVTSIGNYAFEDCTGLRSIAVEEGNFVYHSAGNCLIETASKTLIAGCNTSVIPDDGSVTSIGDWAFFGRDDLTSVTIPDSVTSIEEGAFYGCSGLTSVTIPDSVTSIGERAFYGCSGLTSVTIPDSVTSIGERAFSGCRSLTSVTIPDGVTSIGDYAFYGCSGLTSVTIGNSVTSIGYDAFRDCSSLTSVTFENTMGWYGTDLFGGYASFSSSGLSDSSTAATWLTSKYLNYFWKRNA